MERLIQIAIIILLASCGKSPITNKETGVLNIRYFKYPTNPEKLYEKNLINKNHQIWEIEELHGNENIRTLVAKNIDIKDTSILLLTVDNTILKIIDQELLESQEIRPSAILVNLVNNENILQGLLLMGSSKSKSENHIELFHIAENGEIVKQKSSNDHNLIYNSLPKKSYFEQMEPDSTTIIYEEKYGVEQNTYAYKIIVKSPKRCAIMLQNYEQNIYERKIPITIADGSFENDYITIGEKEIKVELNNYETGCPNEYLNLNKTYTR